MSKAYTKVKRLWGNHLSLQKYMQIKRHKSKKRRHILKRGNDAISVCGRYKSIDNFQLAEIGHYVLLKGFAWDCEKLVKLRDQFIWPTEVFLMVEKRRNQ